MPLLNYRNIEKKLGARFKRRKLLRLAFTHSSYLQTHPRAGQQSNETLEFLGDAVLELVTREYLLTKFPRADEGELSELKKMYTSTKALYEAGKNLGLGKILLMDKGEEMTGGQDRPSNIANCLEAIIGALYVDRGLSYVRKFINQVLFKKIVAEHKDYKSLLNQWVMQNQCKIHYKVAKEEGPSHHKIFYIDLYVNGKKRSQGIGETKKKAEQEAARNFLTKNVK